MSPVCAFLVPLVVAASARAVPAGASAPPEPIRPGTSRVAGELSPDEMLSDLDQLRAALEALHPGLHRFTPPDELEQSFEVAFEQIGEPLDELGFFRVLAPLVASVRCGHTRIRPSDVTYAELRASARQLPLEVRFLGPRSYVVSCGDPGAAVPAGSELLAIDGRPLPEIRARLCAAVSGDGFIATGRLREVERRFAFHYLVHLDAHAERFRLELRDPGEEESVIREVDGLPMQPFGGDVSEREPLLELSRSEDDVAILRVATFGGGGLRQLGYDYEEFLERTFRTLAGLALERLILDLRGNSGGTDEYGALLVSYLSPQEFRYFERIDVTPGYDGGGGVRAEPDGRRVVTEHSGLRAQHPAEHAFGGELVVLIDGGTFSTAADVATVLRQLDRASFVGEECGGGCEGNTSGSSESITLKNSGMVVSIPLWMYSTALEGRCQHGRGVLPEVRVTPAIEEVLRGADPGMRAALERLRSD